MEAGATQGYASWLKRVGAQIVDQFLIAIVAALLGVAVGASAGADAGIGVGASVYFLGMLVYYTVFHGSRSGQTPGKKAVRIAVRAQSGGRASYGQAFGRVAIMWVFQLFSPIQVLNFLWPLWDRRKQALHDKVASTIVVKAEGGRQPAPLQDS